VAVCVDIGGSETAPVAGRGDRADCEAAAAGIEQEVDAIGLRRRDREIDAAVGVEAASRDVEPAVTEDATVHDVMPQGQHACRGNCPENSSSFAAGLSPIG
jgi:hypothetical protein